MRRSLIATLSALAVIVSSADGDADLNPRTFGMNLQIHSVSPHHQILQGLFGANGVIFIPSKYMIMSENISFGTAPAKDLVSANVV